MLAQGKLPFYHINHCSPWFFVGIALLLVVTLGYLRLLFSQMNKLFAKYRLYNIEQEIYLDGKSEFFKIAGGGFAGGFIQGFLGMGCGTCLMMIMTSFPIYSTSASATSGYQYLFTGGASLIQYYINGEVKIVESAWMMGVCCILGGIVTVFVRRYLARLRKSLIDRIIFANIIFLCAMSSVLSIFNIGRTIHRQGWHEVLRIKFSCDK